MITEFDHPEHCWKWTAVELAFLDAKFKEAYDRGWKDGYKHGAFNNAVVTDPAAIREAFETDALHEIDLASDEWVDAQLGEL